MAALETVYSLSGEVPRVEGVIAAGDQSFLRPGALVLGSFRQSCSIRKISGGGAVLHADFPVEPGERLELDLPDGGHLAGRVEWRHGCEVGLRFDRPLDVFAIIARDIVSQPGERRRMPRVELVCPALLETLTRTELVTTRDVSQGGVKIDTPVPLTPDSPVLITLDGFRPIEGMVRWSAGGCAGLAFQPELRWQELMPWLRDRRDMGDAECAAAFAVPPSPMAPAPRAAAAPAEGAVQLNLPARVREGTRRWGIEVAAITARTVEFESFAALRLGTLIWIVLPGLEGWPARIVANDGYLFTCEFTQPLHPAVLERILATARAEG